MPRRSISVLLLLCALVQGLASAQSRGIPDNANRGYIGHIADQIVRIDGREMRLAPGSIIRGTNNLIIVPAALPPGESVADYVIDGNGQVIRVWLLTPEEAARPRTQRSGTGNP